MRSKGFTKVLDGLAKRQLQHDFQLERAAEEYEPVRKIGAGAFGIVCEAIETSSNQKVAIKKIGHASATPTLAKRTLREIRVLRFINHPNIVKLRDIFRTKGSLGTDVYLVMDLMEHNLHQIIHNNKQPLEEELIGNFLKQLLCGLQYLHNVYIAHRDLKPSNLLVNIIDNQYILRIADFGMAKFTAENRKSADADEYCFYMTQHVSTLPYRAPELLFVMPEHSIGVDMWAVGCIFAEMILKRELFPFRSVEDQIKYIVYIFGKPEQHIVNKIKCERTRQLIEKTKDTDCLTDITFDQLLYCESRGEQQINDCNAVDFIHQLLRIDSSERVNVNDAINHEYLSKFTPECNYKNTCPFRVKNDMSAVESLNHEQLTKALCQDVKSAENHYDNIDSGDSTGSKSASSSGDSSLVALDEQDASTQYSNVSDSPNQ